MSRTARNESTEKFEGNDSPPTPAHALFERYLDATPSRPRRAEVFRQMLARRWFAVSATRPLATDERRDAIAAFARYAATIEDGRLDLAVASMADLRALGIEVLFHRPKGDPQGVGPSPLPVAPNGVRREEPSINGHGGADDL